MVGCWDLRHLFSNGGRRAHRQKAATCCYLPKVEQNQKVPGWRYEKKISLRKAAVFIYLFLWLYTVFTHHNVVQLLQMTRSTLTRLSARTHPSHASPIWWNWRRNGLLTRMRSTSQDSSPVIPGCSPACLLETTVRTRATLGFWSDLQSLKRE